MLSLLTRFQPNRATKTEQEETVKKEARPWLIKDIIGAGDTVLLSGRIDAAKTTVAAGWAMSVATGTPWCGRLVTRGSVLYFVRPTEAGRKEFESVSWLYLDAIDSSSDNIAFTTIWSSALDLTPRSRKGRCSRCIFDVLQRHREKHGCPSLVVIDTVYDYFHSDVFDLDEVDKILSTVEVVSAIYKCAVVLIVDVEPGDTLAERMLRRLAKAADVHYVYRVPQSRQAASPDEVLHGTLTKVVSKNQSSSKRFRADFTLPKRQKSKARV